jgi:hypothetical protein
VFAGGNASYPRKRLIAGAYRISGLDPVIRRVEERLRLLQRQPVPHAHANRLRALHALDAGGQFRRQ